MKKLTILFALFSLAMFSCKKSDSGSTGTNPYNYLINGVADVTINPNSSASLGVEVKYSAGTPETVNISVTGLPTGITASVTPASGTPTYTSVITFTASGNIIAGTYPIKIKGTSKSGVVNEYACNLKVAAAVDCAGFLAGTFSGNEQCTSSNDNYSIAILKNNTGNNKIVITNFYNFGIALNATVNCNNNSLTIPSQTASVGGTPVTVSGDGSFTSTYNNIVINYTISTSSVSESCVYTGHK